MSVSFHDRGKVQTNYMEKSADIRPRWGTGSIPVFLGSKTLLIIEKPRPAMHVLTSKVSSTKQKCYVCIHFIPTSYYIFSHDSIASLGVVRSAFSVPHGTTI